MVQADIREAVEAERTPFESWLVKAVNRTRGANLSTGMLWDSWAFFNDKNASEDPIAGQRRDDVSKAFRQCFEMGAPKSVRDPNGNKGNGWPGYVLVAGCEQPDFMTPGALESELACLEPDTCPGLEDIVGKHRCKNCVDRRVALLESQQGAAPNALFDLQDILPRLRYATTPRLVDMVELVQEELTRRREDAERSQLRLSEDPDYVFGYMTDMFEAADSAQEHSARIEGMDVILAGRDKEALHSGDSENLESHKILMQRLKAAALQGDVELREETDGQD